MTFPKFVSKPWGHEEIWAVTDAYVAKYLYIKSGHRLSRQYHEIKEETIRVLKGILIIETGDDDTLSSQQLSPGEIFHVAPNTIHRFGAHREDVILVEVSTPEIDDVVRLADDYNRTPDKS